MAPCRASLLLNTPLPLSDIALGRLVPDVLRPDSDFHQPSLRLRMLCPQKAFTVFAPFNAPMPVPDLEGTSSARDPDDSSPATAVVHTFENVTEILSRTRGTRLGSTLAGIFSATYNLRSKSSETLVTAEVCKVYELRDPKAYFRAACEDWAVRAWLEEQARRRSGTKVYLVCGFKTFTNARVEERSRREGGLQTAVSSHAAGPSSATIATESVTATELSYTAPGELVYAVKFRQVRFSRFNTRKVDRAYLDEDTRWEFVFTRRGGGSGGAGEWMDDGYEEIGELDGLDVGLEEELDLDGLDDSFEIHQGDGEMFLMRI